MSENLDLVRSIFAAGERGDYAPSEWAHPEIEFVVAEGPSPGSRTGLTGMQASLRDWRDTWEEFRIEVDEYRELDGERVLALGHRTARGQASGLELGQTKGAGVALFHVRDGKVVRLAIYWDRDHAFADLGLTE